MTRLFDASSLFFVLLKLELQKAAELLSGNGILDLTGYEVGNAVWKQCKVFRVLSEEEAVRFMSSFSKILREMQVFSITDVGMEEVEELALHQEISFYDTSYIYVAKQMKMDLVTDDNKLASVAAKYVPVVSYKEL